jgi:hypothetical protein
MVMLDDLIFSYPVQGWHAFPSLFVGSHQIGYSGSFFLPGGRKFSPVTTLLPVLSSRSRRALRDDWTGIIGGHVC